MKEANIHRSPCIIKGDLLNFEEVDGKHGIQKVRLNIRKLYPECRKREEFKRKFRRFLDSDCCNRKVIDCLKDSEVLTYRTECIIPVETNSKPSLFLIRKSNLTFCLFRDVFLFRKEGRTRASLLEGTQENRYSSIQISIEQDKKRGIVCS